MAISLDASSPIAAQITGNGSGTDTGTSASFTPPVGALIYASGCFNTGVSASPSFSVSNTGGGLSAWTQVAVRTNASGGSVVVYYASVTSSVATTVTLTCTSSGNTNTNWNGELFTDVWTGAASTQTGAATGTGTSTTQNISPTVTTTANGSQVAGVAIEWGKFGAPTSTDTYNAYDSSAPGTSGIRAYKASPVATPASTSINFNAAAASPVWGYALYEILAVVGPTITSQPQNTRVRAGGTAGFSVTATGSGSLTYQWKLGGTDIGGATSSSYTTGTLTQSDDGGLYSVVVTDSGGNTTSGNARLGVDANTPGTLGQFDKDLRILGWF